MEEVVAWALWRWEGTPSVGMTYSKEGERLGQAGMQPVCGVVHAEDLGKHF